MEIEQIVQATIQERNNPNPWPYFNGPGPHTEKEIRDQSKNLTLAMQGAWTSQHHHSWERVNSKYEEHCPGPVHMWCPNTVEALLQIEAEPTTSLGARLHQRLFIPAGHAPTQVSMRDLHSQRSLR